MENIKTISPDKQEQARVTLNKASLAHKNLHLSIEVRESNLLACLLDKDTNQYLAWSSYNRSEAKPASGKTADIKRPIESILQEEILNYKCSGSSVVFTHNSAMLIPVSFFSRESLKDYLKQQNLIRQDETPCSDFIKNNDCYSVYAVNSADYSRLKEKYPQAAFRHHSSVFVEYLLALHKDSRGSEVHVYIFDGYMDVVALSQRPARAGTDGDPLGQSGKLLLYNRYYFQTPDDFTYFLLWMYEELKLKPEDSSCFLYGEIAENSEIFTLAQKYLKNIRLAERTGRFTFSHILESLPAQRYYSLFMQYLCI